MNYECVVIIAKKMLPHASMKLINPQDDLSLNQVDFFYRSLTLGTDFIWYT